MSERDRWRRLEVWSQLNRNISILPMLLKTKRKKCWGQFHVDGFGKTSGHGPPQLFRALPFLPLIYIVRSSFPISLSCVSSANGTHPFTYTISMPLVHIPTPVWEMWLCGPQGDVLCSRMTRRRHTGESVYSVLVKYWNWSLRSGNLTNYRL